VVERATVWKLPKLQVNELHYHPYKMAASILDMINLKCISRNAFESLALPEGMANTANIAYGGCVLSMVVSAAFQSLETSSRGRMALYSALGHFLGPALTDRTVILRVTSLRDTRTFSTKQVIASQRQDDGSERACTSAQLDFIISPTDDPDVHSFLRYSIPPPRTTNPADVPLFLEKIKNRVKNGDLNPNVENTYITNFKLFERLFDSKMPSGSPLTENVFGIDKTRKISQDHLPLTSKRTLDYFRSKRSLKALVSFPDTNTLPISSSCLNFASLAFAMDAIIAFVPLSLSHHFLPDVAACSSLDFALRFHTEIIDMGSWHLRELRTVVGDFGRTFNEARVWDESGRLVATMSQQDILRPHKGNGRDRTHESKL
jgi:acyl-CoA thioesterase II